MGNRRTVVWDGVPAFKFGPVGHHGARRQAYARPNVAPLANDHIATRFWIWLPVQVHEVPGGVDADAAV